MLGTALVLALGLRASAPGQHAPAVAEAPKHWALVAPQSLRPPVVRNQRWARNPIDLFVLARLEREGITPSPEADRRTLIRRLSLDLLGLPPTPAAVRTFLEDDSPSAYERLVDSLLASPHFGERWGRHWLDLARYADSSGYQVDRPRPAAYRFRDWVIDAVNDDMPFDQFTIQQLAGDLLPDEDAHIAAGFHRMTLSNHEDGVDAEEFACKAKVDRVSTTATVWLGLTLGCAECHNHKYDPLTQREFYQIYAFFNHAEECDAPSGIGPARTAPPAQAAAEPPAQAAEAGRARSGLLPPSDSRNSDPRFREMKRQTARRRRTEGPTNSPAALSFHELTNAARTFIHIRGDFLRHGDEVRPGTPAVLPPLRARGACPDRLDLARWLVDPANPLTARVAVNQAWQHLFGRGLVGTPEDFGTRGEPPSHPELLDWLAVAFAAPREAEHSPPEIRGLSSLDWALGWSRKQLLRLIVTSATYRQSSRVRPELMERDPLNVLLARQGRFRVEAEVLRDLYLAASGLLNEQIGGPSFHPFLAEDLKKLGSAGAFSWTDSEGPEKYRRGIYIYAQRTVPYPAAMTFDQADPAQSCVRRERSDTPLQALTLLNHGLFVECAQALGRRLLAMDPVPPRTRLARAFEDCLSRPPSAAELNRLLALYADQRRLVERAPASFAQAAGGVPPAQVPEAASWIGLSQVLLNLDEFMTRE